MPTAPLRATWYEVREWVTAPGAEWWRCEDPDRDEQYEFESAEEAWEVVDRLCEEEDPAHRRDHLFVVHITAEEVPRHVEPPAGG